MSSQLTALHSMIDKLVTGQNTVSQTVGLVTNVDLNTGSVPVDQGSNNAESSAVVASTVDGQRGRNAVSTADLANTRVSDTISLLRHSAYSINKRPASSALSTRSSSSSGASCSTKRSRRDSSDHRDPEQQELEDDTDRDYTDKATYGPEVSSVIACAQKIYWQRAPNADVANQLLERNKVPANCKFMTTKVANTTVFAKTSGDIHSKETEMQKLDKLHASSTTAIVKATHQLFRVKQELKELQDQHQDITFPNIDDQINLLKDGLKL